MIYASPLLVAVLCGLGGESTPTAGAVNEVVLELPRHAFYRGENIPVTVRGLAAAKDASVAVFLDARCLARGTLQDGRALRGAHGRCQGRAIRARATVRSAAGELSATESVTVARRPPADRLEIWLRAHGDDDYSFYFDHGFTIAGGPDWAFWRPRSTAYRSKELDDRLTRGVYATIGPVRRHRRLR